MLTMSLILACLHFMLCLLYIILACLLFMFNMPFLYWSMWVVTSITFISAYPLTVDMHMYLTSKWLLIYATFWEWIQKGTNTHMMTHTRKSSMFSSISVVIISLGYLHVLHNLVLFITCILLYLHPHIMYLYFYISIFFSNIFFWIWIVFCQHRFRDFVYTCILLLHKFVYTAQKWLLYSVL